MLLVSHMSLADWFCLSEFSHLWGADGACWEGSRCGTCLDRPLCVDAVDVTEAGNLRRGLGGMSVWCWN